MTLLKLLATPRWSLVRPAARQPVTGEEVIMTHISTTTAAVGGSGARRHAQRGRLHHSRVGRGARRAVRAGRRRARSASWAPARLRAGPHTRHAGGGCRDWWAPGGCRRRRGGLVRRARRAPHRRPAAGARARPRAGLARA